jgi:hypothetical protein
MKTDISPDSLYWASFNRFELRLPGQCVLDCSHSGQCDEDVAHWAPKIAAIVESDGFPLRPTPDKIRAELKEYGAWTTEDLADDEANWQRLVWIAACNVAESDSPDCTAPISA